MFDTWFLSSVRQLPFYSQGKVVSMGNRPLFVKILAIMLLAGILLTLGQQAWASDKKALNGVEKKSFRLHIDSYLNQDDARSEQDRLKQLGYKTVLEAHKVSDLTWYRIFSGDYDTFLDAIAAGEQLVRRQIIVAYNIDAKPRVDASQAFTTKTETAQPRICQ
jgi:hypothetical protein